MVSLILLLASAIYSFWLWRDEGQNQFFMFSMSIFLLLLSKISKNDLLISISIVLVAGSSYWHYRAGGSVMFLILAFALLPVSSLYWSQRSLT